LSSTYRCSSGPPINKLQCECADVGSGSRLCENSIRSGRNAVRKDECQRSCALRLTTGLKIPGACILCGVFTQPGPTPTRRTHCSKVPYVFDDLVRARKQYPWNDQSKRFSAALERHAKSGVLGQRSAICRSPAPAGDTSTPGPSTIDRLGALAIKFRALRAKRAIC
jgi:hypothetical protein